MIIPLCVCDVWINQIARVLLFPDLVFDVHRSDEKRQLNSRFHNSWEQVYSRSHNLVQLDLCRPAFVFITTSETHFY